jgi:hypothetical protein
MKREVPEWTRTPAGAWEYYQSLTFEERTALAFVIDLERRRMQDMARDVLQDLEKRYGVSGSDSPS